MSQIYSTNKIYFFDFQMNRLEYLKFYHMQDSSIYASIILILEVFINDLPIIIFTWVIRIYILK